MLSVSNDQTMKNVTCQFCYSSTMEELMSFHVMAEPELHPSCADFVLHLYQSLPEEVQKEIDFLGECFGKWHYALDLVGMLVEENANYQCDYEIIEEKVLLLPTVEFLYYVLGLEISGISLETFREWYPDEKRCEQELKKREYHLIAMDKVIYLFDHTGEIRSRLLQVLKNYWDLCFKNEWETISGYVRDIIEYEQLSLEHTTLLSYLEQFHKNLRVENGMLIFDKKPPLTAVISRIELLTITPTIFGDSHLHGNVDGKRVNLNLNLDYRALQVSKPIPDAFFQLMRVISDESRFKILKVLWKGDATTKTISGILRISPSTVSIHLKVLKEADLVTCSKVKKFVYYRLKKDRLLTLQDELLNYLKY